HIDFVYRTTSSYLRTLTSSGEGTSTMKVGFIGLGTMGAGMALNLRKAGHDLLVHDLRKESARRHLDAGATWAERISEIGRACDVVFTSVPGPREMQQVGIELLGPMRRGAVWFDLTTNSPTV